MSTEKNEGSGEYFSTELSSNMEDYMETIAVLSANQKVVRVKDIAKKLEIKMPSVTAALNKLKDMELIEYEKYGFIELTEKGKKTALRVLDRHNILSDFFQSVLNMKINEAEDVACKIEHVISPEACIKLEKMLKFYKKEKTEKKDWIPRFQKAIDK